MREALIVDAVRSPIGKRNGSLSKIRAEELAGQVLNGLVGRQELDPVEIVNPRVGMLFEVDETPRADTSPEALAELAPAFLPDGKVTAGNSSQICDGAAAVLIASEAACSRLGFEPRARFVSFGLVGVDPRLMLHGNPQASERALAKAGLGWDDIAVIEVNEAFAS